MTKTRPLFAVLALGAALVLSGCGAGEPDLRDVRSTGDGPEEFGIVPNKPLEIPEDLAALPAPTPGGANRTTPTPLADAVVALGGSPDRATPDGAVPAADEAIVRQAGRFGVAPDIRGVLAEEDLADRGSGALFTWQLFPGDRYNAAYESQRLDAQGTVERFRRAGARTPSAPPRDDGR